jgi:hypothetical protein
MPTLLKRSRKRTHSQKGELDRKQALETEALKERQAEALQDKQKGF